LRTGLAAAFVKDMTEKKTVEGTYSAISRGLHSAAPTFGQAIVALVQDRCPEEWRENLKEARGILQRKRKLMLEHLPERFHNSLSGYGMFAMLPLTVDQVNRLKHEYKTFILLDGRINIGGIPEARITELCRNITAVL
jgi:aspartate/tyrosine/aromatic aminotransferase